MLKNTPLIVSSCFMGSSCWTILNTFSRVFYDIMRSKQICNCCVMFNLEGSKYNWLFPSRVVRRKYWDCSSNKNKIVNTCHHNNQWSSYYSLLLALSNRRYYWSKNGLLDRRYQKNIETSFPDKLRRQFPLEVNDFHFLFFLLVTQYCSRNITLHIDL